MFGQQDTQSLCDGARMLTYTYIHAQLENILRDDLAQRFVECQEQATRELWKKERQNPLLYSLKPQVAFHGTLSRSLPSIGQ